MIRLLTLLVVLVAVPATTSGQAPLADVLDELTGLWARGEVAGIAALVAEDGVEFEVDGRTTGILTGRKVVAALRRLFEDTETVSVRANLSSRVVGTDDQAFAELVWDARPPGGTVAERSTVFLALVRQSQGWRVSQIRILP